MCKHFLENVGSALIPGFGEKKAADAQTYATEQGINKEGEIYGVNKDAIAKGLTDSNALLSPYQQGGLNAFGAYGQAMGFTPSDDPYGGFQQSPGYQFAFDEGMRGVNNAFAARGMLNSGARMKALTKYGQGIADQEYQNYLNNAFRGAGLGFQAAGAGVNNIANYTGMGVNDAARYADNFANLWQNKGAAQASRFAGVANAWSPVRDALVGGGLDALGLGGGGGGFAKMGTGGDWITGPQGFPV